jgi:hypothetical protein
VRSLTAALPSFRGDGVRHLLLVLVVRGIEPVLETVGQFRGRSGSLIKISYQDRASTN